MRADMNQARAFGRRVAEAQDDALREHDALREARALWLAPPLARAPRPRGAKRAPGAIDWRTWGGVALAAVLAAAGVAFFASAPAASLAFQVGPSEEAIAGLKPRPGVVGELVAAPTAARLPVRFSDGSLVRLEPDARARFVEVRDNGSRVLLESGVAHANVVHRADTRWTVQAGSFEVRVTGTQFDVAWDPLRGLFSITLQEGRVVVSGCAMDQARVVSAGETFRATCKDDERGRSLTSSSVPPISAPTSTPAPLAPTSPPVVVPVATSPAPTSLALPAPPVATSHSTWRELLALHRYAEAFDVADAVGISSICASTDVATLMDLSDAARFAGHADRAKFVLEEVRRRFAGDERASVAAFNLGRIAFDDAAAYAEAARWFGTYLTERPGGSLAREAAGRRMEALERSGDHAAAKGAAKRYLEEFPAGPHAEVAKSIADR
jgi:transmembrane sensor